MDMPIYLVTRKDPGGYDTYDSFVCRAENEQAAKFMFPDEGWEYNSYGLATHPNDRWNTWVDKIDDVEVEEISVENGVILASFNAG